MKRHVFCAAAAVAVAVPLSIGTAQAAEDWKFGASLYGYFPDVGGTTSFPATGEGSSATVDISTILDSLKMNFAATLEAHNGRWGMYTDVYYVDLGQVKSQTRDFTLGGAGLPANVNANLDFDMKATMWTLGGAWRVSSNRDSVMDIVAGARMLDMAQDLKWELTGDVAGIPIATRADGRNVDATNWDGIVGLKGRASFGEGNRWFVPYYADVGAGDSNLTWQAYAGIGYSFGWGSVVALWRYIDYDLKSGKPVQSLTMNGPAIGAVFHW